MMPDKAAAGVYYVHQIQTRCGALTMQTTTAPVSASRRAAATPTAATHGHHFSTQVAVQHRLQHVNDRITQDAQLVLTAVHEDAGVDGDVDGEDDDDDDVVVVTSKMTVQRARPALHTAATGVTSAVDALQVIVAHDTTSPARRCKTVTSWPRLPRWSKAWRCCGATRTT